MAMLLFTFCNTQKHEKEEMYIYYIIIRLSCNFAFLLLPIMQFLAPFFNFSFIRLIFKVFYYF